ncbi:MAG: YraN family protein [Saprospiraceae bacterium]|nr:YraN family protein [Saprospiraceae bacterium]
MGPDHIQTGKKGEDLANKYLLEIGYEIIIRNWRYRRSEIDIIAKHGEILVFVEVKTRSSSAFGEPESFVSSRKEWMMQEAAAAYMVEKNHYWEIRFDVIGILFDANGTYELKHYKDVFL